MYETKLNPEFKTKWLEALRSGKYEQTTQVLRDGMGFCCLGVACDLVDPSGWGDRVPNVYGHPVIPYTLGAVQMVTSPPPAVDLAMFQGGRGKAATDDLMEMNDSGMSFSDIADYIEEKL